MNNLMLFSVLLYQESGVRKILSYFYHLIIHQYFPVLFLCPLPTMWLLNYINFILKWIIRCVNVCVSIYTYMVDRLILIQISEWHWDYGGLHSVRRKLLNSHTPCSKRSQILMWLLNLFLCSLEAKSVSSSFICSIH